MTLIDSAADTAYEPRNETKQQRIEAWKGLMSSNHLDDRVCHTFPCDLILLVNESVDSAALFKFSFCLKHICVDVITSLNSLELVTANA